jgi:hypothetical protein
LSVGGNTAIVGTIRARNANYTFTLPNVGAAGSWIRLGTFTASQVGNHLFIKVVTSVGYNADPSQQSEIYIHFKTSNGSSVNANGFAGESTFYVTNANGSAYNVKVVGNAAGVSATSYDIFFFQAGAYNGDGSFYTVELDQVTSTWTNAATTASDPGVASSTVAFGINRFTIQSNVRMTGNTITNSIVSSDSNLRYRFDTANRRVLTNIYGFDFIDNGGIITPTNKTRYLYGGTGSNQTLVVPAGVFYIFVKMWGAGGGGGSYGGWRQGSLGGAGGFSHGIIPVVPGETITIRVGVLGSARPAAAVAYPDGGGASTAGGDNRYAGGGGGSSSILVPSQSNQYVIVAGGGGGGGAVNSYDLNSGGAGGGLIGECGHITGINGNSHNGKGGTQSAGGAAGVGNNSTGGAGASFAGGTHQNGNCYGGGGGGGFFGGGSGAYGNGNSMGGGGGGSGRIHSSVIMGATYTGQSFIPPFYNDPDLAIDTQFRYARGGDEGGQGGHGLVVLYY